MTPPVSYSVTGSTTSVTGVDYNATGTAYELVDFRQKLTATYTVVTWGVSGSWPPSGACETVSGIHLEGLGYTHQSVYDYISSSNPSIYQQQTYAFTQDTSSVTTSGLGLAGNIAPDQEAVHIRVKDTGDIEFFDDSLIPTGWSGNRIGVLRITNPRIIDGNDGGVAARNFINSLIYSWRWGRIPVYNHSLNDSLPRWRADLVI